LLPKSRPLLDEFLVALVVGPVVDLPALQADAVLALDLDVLGSDGMAVAAVDDAVDHSSPRTPTATLPSEREIAVDGRGFEVIWADASGVRAKVVEWPL